MLVNFTVTCPPVLFLAPSCAPAFPPSTHSLTRTSAPACTCAPFAGPADHYDTFLPPHCPTTQPLQTVVSRRCCMHTRPVPIHSGLGCEDVCVMRVISEHLFVTLLCRALHAHNFWFRTSRTLPSHRPAVAHCPARCRYLRPPAATGTTLTLCCDDARSTSLAHL